LNYDLIETQRPGHAFEIVRDTPTGKYDAFVTISGDGLIHESINGAMNRSDHKQFLAQTSFGFIPAGTSNGLYASIADFGGEKDDIKSAAFVVAKGRSTKMDITKLNMEYYPNTPLYMFLSLNYAFIADTDINSEWMRSIGTLRYTL
jgi:sphingosine kinase